MNGSRVMANTAGTEFDSEDEVGKLDQNQGHEQRCRVSNELAGGGIRTSDEKALAFELGGDANVAAHPFQDGVALEVGFAIGGDQHLDARHDQEYRKHIEHPLEPMDEGGADADHYGAHDDDAEDAVEQHAMLVLRWDREVAEDHRHDEDVVDGKRLLDEPARQIQFKGVPAAFARGCGVGDRWVEDVAWPVA